MNPIPRPDNLEHVRSDIRGPLYEEALRMGAAGETVLRLNTGNPATFGFQMPASVKNALLENADRAVAYCDLRGMPEAREAICAYHQSEGFPNVTVDDIFVGNGVSELVTMVLLSLLSRGDELLTPMPSYSLWTNSTYLAGAKPVFYVCDESADWMPDLDDIRRKITPKTRAILLINPNNPTGAVYPRELLEQIVQIAREHNLVIFSDEIYNRLVLDDLPYTSVAALAPDVPVITMNGLSKSHIVCGFRCGWMVVSGDKKALADVVTGMTQLASMRLCGNALAQLVIPAALADRESTRAMIVPGGRLYEQREATVRELSKIEGISFVKNKAAFYIFPKIDVKRFHITDDERFNLDLLHAKKILMIPGRGFDWPNPDHFRVVMLPEPETMAKAIRDLGDFLATYHQS